MAGQSNPRTSTEPQTSEARKSGNPAAAKPPGSAAGKGDKKEPGFDLRKWWAANSQRWLSALGSLLWLILGALVLAGVSQLWISRPADRQGLVILAAIVGLVGVYPVSYLAYHRFGAKAQRRRLQDDFRLLGLVKEDELEITVTELYNTIYHPIQFLAYICLIVLVLLLVVYGYVNRDTLPLLPPANMALVFYASLGAYVFSVQELVRRYNTSDLLPQVYSSILVRLLISVLLVFVGAGVILLSGGQLGQPAGDNPSPVDPQAWAAILAFVIGIFPETGLRWFTQQANRVLNPAVSNASDLPLRDLMGISPWHATRLSQMGLDDAQNLATVDIRRLLLTTQFDTQQIVQWIDQAILYVKVGGKLPRCRDAGIGSFHELVTAVRALSVDPNLQLDDQTHQGLMQARERLAAGVGLPSAEALERLADYTDFPNYAFLREYYLRTLQVARQRAQVGMDRVLGALEETDYESAKENGERLLKQNDQDAKLHNQVGFAYYQLSQQARGKERVELRDKAFKHYNDATALDPLLAPAYYNRSLIYVERGDTAEALKDCTSAIAIDARNAPAFNNRGLVHIKTGYWDRALEDLNEALHLDEHFGVAYLNRGVAYLAQGKFELAADDFERAHLLSEDKAELWIGWGKALNGWGDQLEASADAERRAQAARCYQGAIDKLSWAVWSEGDSVQASAARGYAYLQLGSDFYRQAEADLQTALSHDGSLLDAHLWLGQIYYQQKNYLAARAQYAAVIEAKNPHFEIMARLALGICSYHLSLTDDTYKAEAMEQFQAIINQARGTVEAQKAQEYLDRLTAAPAPGEENQNGKTN